MTLEEVLNQAMRAYMDGEELGEYNKAGSEFKYTKKFFDDADTRILPPDAMTDDEDDD